MSTVGLKHLKTGWKDPKFEQKLADEMNRQLENGFEYRDIKISSSSNDCLIIFIQEAK
jgi:hypothetical protein